MCFDERNTLRRGRVFPPRRTPARTRLIRRSCVFVFMAALLLLAFLAVDVLVRVLHTLALVRFRRTVSADFRGDLPYLLRVDAGDDDFRRLRRLDLDAGRDRVLHLVAVAESQVELLAGDRGAITDA